MKSASVIITMGLKPSTTSLQFSKKISTQKWMGEFITIWLPSDIVLICKNLYLWKINVAFYYQQVWYEHSPCSLCHSHKQKQLHKLQGNSLKLVQNHTTQTCCTRQRWWHPRALRSHSV